MPSTIIDFQEPVKKMSSDVLIANNQADEVNYNILKDNIYKRTVTIDNSGKSAKTNYIISFVFDHLTLWRNDKTAFNFCDLRVYDSNGTTLLNHEVQSYCTSYCLISVSVPSIAAGASKNIFIEYGNVALANLSNRNIWSGALTGTSLVGHFMANEANRLFNNNLVNDQEAQIWQNQKPSGKILKQTDGTKAPTLKTNQLNGLPVLRFDGSNDFLTSSTVNIDLNGSTGFSLFFVAKASSTANYQSIIRFQETGQDYVVLPYSNGQFISSTELGALSGCQLNPIANQFILGNGNWKKATAGGFNTYLNGTLQTSKNSQNANNSSTKLGVGSFFNGGSEFFNGDLAEILIFDRSLTNLGRQQVELYLNTKYRLYATSDMPTITVGSESTIDKNYTYTSYAPVVNWTSSTNFENNVFGIQKTSSKININNVFESTLVAGVNSENWNNSTQYSNAQLSLSSIILPFCRTRNISTTPAIDSVNIQAIDTNNSSLNINRLDNFCIYNEVDNTYLSYTSDDNDYITLEFSCDDASNIDLATSYFLLSNVGITLTYKAFLTANNSTIENGISNKIRIKKSQFVKTGSGSWADITVFRSMFVSNSGTNNIYYGNLQLVQNIENKNQYQIGQKIKLSNAVSSDNGATYYTHHIHNNIVDNQSITDDISFTSIDYLDLVSSLKMADVNAFSGDSITFNSQVELSAFVPNHKVKFFTYFVQKLLGFVFPSTLLDVDLDLLIVEDESNDVVSLNYFNINENDKFGDVLNELLIACGGTLVYDSITNKYIARNSYKNIDTTAYTTSGLQLTTAYTISNNIIYSYKTDTRGNDYIYNYIKLIAVVDNLFSNYIIYAEDACSYRIKGFGRTTIFLELDSASVYVANLEVLNWLVAPSATSDVYNNSNVSITSIFYASGRIGITFNNDTSDRYLRKIEVTSDSIVYSNIESYFGSELYTATEFTKIISDKNSIAKYGRKEYEISSKYHYVTFDNVANDGTLIVANFYQGIINQMKADKQSIEVELDFNPDIRIGQVVKIRTQTGKVLLASVINVDQNSSPPDFDTTIKIIELT